ncbi:MULTISPECIES: dTDP-4-dehydrorhamnose reductase [unclassified Streptomyces]|uniref:dTDP-4-dehydrorhamnose reductase n=1 Tax=unclassified Streptomyces TaxID=2593676 RepID=UPI002DDA718F|nr:MULTISPECIES: dTDP-4-dehydrorhamnose reductase [unclassified Streptomyces]WSF86797.1 dTDP-4-dehydrorhamnose reductase [Streptomyces sp. NBC_01744]WSC45062.1 dTDP-4-dehydrorhamnose reductase [Streptomyces sp. NBC_01762]WSC55950.1 dTDP-4-dehydrorhamnose reductase [Streptomyces sp. NBC_01761]WSD24722.1 dTDP-4-dehydrorhamnose reductase [Streptomyces sp. NBC_01751]WSJ53358.1 dTDP-4-dehydrorhamnose reductase [Streptomyces sp. NBC_01318]
MSPVWLVTGAAGMLGRDVLARLAGESVTAVAANRVALDIADPALVRAALEFHRPAVVVNCAAWTAVDDAESREEAALRVNGTGPEVLAAACREHGVVLLQVSTDYVFAGDTEKPYPEDAAVGPRSAYGRTKLAGERAVLDTLPDTGYVVRTAWLYGAHGPNFVRTMIKLEGVKDALDVVDDQRGQPTWTADLADRLVRLGQAALAGAVPAGIYHGTSGGQTTWFGFTREIFRLLGADPARVRPTTSDAFVRPAPRPAFSVLGHDRWAAAGMEPIRDWRAALEEAFPALLAAERRGSQR